MASQGRKTAERMWSRRQRTMMDPDELRSRQSASAERIEQMRGYL